MPSDDFSIPSKSINSGPSPPWWTWTVSGKSLCLKRLQVYLFLQRLHGLLAFGIFRLSQPLFFVLSALIQLSRRRSFSLYRFPLCPSSERLFLHSGLFEMLLIAHPERKKYLFFYLFYCTSFPCSEDLWLRFRELRCRQCNYTASFHRFLFRWAMKCFWMFE